MIFLSFFAVPLVLTIVAYIWFGNRISWKELILQLFVQSVLVGIICGVVYYRNTTDVEIWNGRVSSKTKERVSCSHSYSCNCHEVCSGSGKDESCHQHCDTCYEHSYDIDWDVATTNGENLTIERVDRQGLSEPKRWTDVRIGDPTAQTHYYENYIKAAPDSLFRTQGDTTDPMPEYPAQVYDYYRLDHLVQFGSSISDAKLWNDGLAELNASLGRPKQVNAVLVLAKGKSREWFRQLERHWIGGKKNDAIVVLGLNSDDTIAWAEVMAWTDHSYFKVKLRDEILSVGKLDRLPILSVISEVISKDFRRKPMSDFEYLRSSVAPTRTEFVVGFIVSLIFSVCIIGYCKENDIFGDESGQPGSGSRFFGGLNKLGSRRYTNGNSW